LILKNRTYLFCAVIAEKDGKTVVFGDIDGDYINRLYAHKDFQRQGIETVIIDCLQQYALKNNCTRIFADISITAKPFFEKQGFSVLKEQQVIRYGITLKILLWQKIW